MRVDEGWVCGLVWAAVLGIAVEDGVNVSRVGAPLGGLNLRFT